MNSAVVVRHDTTMWNEGFESAREPLVTVVVGHAAQVTSLIDIVSAHNAKMERSLTWDRLFDVASHPSNEPALSYDDARRRLEAAIRGWEGI